MRTAEPQIDKPQKIEDMTDMRSSVFNILRFVYEASKPAKSGIFTPAATFKRASARKT